MSKIETKIDVRLEGLADILFDKFIDHSKEERPPEQKIYLSEDNLLVFPSENIRAFLFGVQNPPGCAKRCEGKKHGEYVATGLGHVIPDNPPLIPFLDENDQPIKFQGFEDGKFWILKQAPRTKMAGSAGSIKQEVKPRPVLKLPWSLNFQIGLVDNNIIDENKLHNWFDRGGLIIALGSYRPRFGRFHVTEWEVS